jgi:hypothetical protein
MKISLLVCLTAMISEVSVAKYFYFLIYEKYI